MATNAMVQETKIKPGEIFHIDYLYSHTNGSHIFKLEMQNIQDANGHLEILGYNTTAPLEIASAFNAMLNTLCYREMIDNLINEKLKDRL